VPIHYLHYEDYEHDYNATVSDLYEFLDTPIVDEPLEFIVGKTYEDFYDAKSMRAAKLLVKALASNETWSLVEQYFSEIDE
jgi:hypothetical protein